MQLTKDDYIARIRNATPVQLIIITFELTIVNLEDAKKTENEEDFEKYIRKSQDFLMQLMSSLDMKYEISSNLLNIYLYVNKLLHKAYFSKSISSINECLELLGSLLLSFEMISENTEGADAVLSVSQSIYAGLTYKNGQLNEMIIEDIESGFKA